MVRPRTSGLLLRISRLLQSWVLRHKEPGWTEILGVALLGIAFTTTWAAVRGKDVGWDLLNYHYYTVYAWLNHRVTFHIAPAQRQSWINPLVYLPQYLLIKHAAPIIAGALFGAFAGLNFVLVYALTRCMLSTEEPGLAMAIGLLSASVGISGPQFLEQLGQTASDITVSIPVLAGFLAICWSHRPGATSRIQNLGYALSGLLLGAACGLKLTCMVYAAGLTLSLVALWPRLRVGARRFAFYSAGGVLGFLLTGGYWSWFLWREYRNPVFPFYNAIIRSPWAAAKNFQDLRFQPRAVADAITYPFQWLVGLHPTSEGPFRDARYALFAVLLATTILSWLWTCRGVRSDRQRQKSARLLAGRNHFWLMIIFFVISYVLWITAFAVQRYLMPIGLISGLMLFLLLDEILESRASKTAIFTALALFSIAWTKPYPYERLPFGKDWFGVRLVPAVSLPGTLFIMLGDAPTGYVVPFLPGSARAVRLTGNMPLQLDTGLGHQAMELITNHKGPIRSLAASPLTPADRSQLINFGLVLDQAQCETFRSDVDEFTSCPLIRETDSPLDPQAGRRPGRRP